MNEEQKKILLKALEDIRQFCESFTHCSYCPLREADCPGNCYLKDRIPSDWQIKTKEETLWRAFDD